MIIAGIDASYRNGKAIVAGVICEYPHQRVIEKKICYLSENSLFPYIPGLLFLKEGPLVLKILKKFNTRPQILIVNGHGKAHPTGFGLAVFVEEMCSIPTIGCAKELLIGNYKNLNLIRGEFAYVVYNSKRIGIAVCTRNNTRPLILSSGGKLNLKEIYKICLLTTHNTRWPYPLYLADKESKKTIPEQD
jgi:deoxyribonuclease V